MAIFKTTLFEAQEAALENSAKLNSEGSLFTGQLNVTTARITFEAAQTAGNHTIKVCRLPTGARVVPQLCSVYSSSLYMGGPTIPGFASLNTNLDQHFGGFLFVESVNQAFYELKESGTDSPLITQPQLTPLAKASDVNFSVTSTGSSTAPAGHIIEFTIVFANAN